MKANQINRNLIASSIQLIDIPANRVTTCTTANNVMIENRVTNNTLITLLNPFSKVFTPFIFKKESQQKRLLAYIVY
jgi:hypothetical protein